MSDKTVYSIGYAGFGNDSASFIDTLKHFGINVLVDVRSSPFSAYYTAYNREPLEKALLVERIYYRNYANEFGARQDDRSFYPNGYLDFDLFSESEAFQSGVDKILKAMDAGYTVAFMCAEKEPVTCHRAILVTRAFSKKGIPVLHILPNLQTKTQADIEEELLILHPRSLFDPPEVDDLTLAYRKQNAAIGYKLGD